MKDLTALFIGVLTAVAMLYTADATAQRITPLTPEEYNELIFDIEETLTIEEELDIFDSIEKLEDNLTQRVGKIELQFAGRWITPYQEHAVSMSTSYDTQKGSFKRKHPEFRIRFRF